MNLVKRVTLEFFKNGENQMTTKLTLAKPYLTLPEDKKTHREIIQSKLISWGYSADKDQVVVRYKVPFDGERSFIFVREEIKMKKS
jgi:hypothetical protein